MPLNESRESLSFHAILFFIALIARVFSPSFCWFVGYLQWCEGCSSCPGIRTSPRWWLEIRTRNGSRCAFGEATPRSSMTLAAVGTKQTGRDGGRFPDNPAEILKVDDEMFQLTGSSLLFRRSGRTLQTDTDGDLHGQSHGACATPHPDPRTHAHSHTHTRAHARTHTHTHTHTRPHTCWFLWFTGTFHRRNGFYTVQTVCAIALHLPYT